MAMFARKFWKFLKFNKDKFENDFKKFENSKHDKVEKIPKIFNENLNRVSLIGVTIVRVMVIGILNAPLN